MFFNTQNRATAIDTSLHTGAGSSSILPGLSTGNPFDSSSAISQSQRMVGASQSLSTLNAIPMADSASVVTRGRLPAAAVAGSVNRGRTLVADPLTPPAGSVSRGRTLVTDPTGSVGRGRTLVTDPVTPPAGSVGRGRTLVTDPVTPPTESVSRGRTLVTDPTGSVSRGRTLVTDPVSVVTRGRIPLPGPTLTSFALTADPGGTPGNALDLGFIRANSPKTVNDSVSNIDLNDFYRFTVDTDNHLSLRLSGLSADADLEIIRDSNGNGLVDPGEVIAKSQNGGSNNELIDLQGMSGRYYARVLSYNGINNTNYTLSLSASGGAFGTAPEPNNSLSQAYDISTLNGNRNFSGFVSTTSDQKDVYRFSLDTTSNFKLVLSGLSQDADVEVILDSNYNNVIDVGEVIGQGHLAGNSRESFDLQNLASGDYFVQVHAYSDYGATNATNYNLFLLGQPV
ncbi:MAG: pre-peptidase C-terminal domain-containing protein [Leptolyngbya sp. BL-A-14]